VLGKTHEATFGGPISKDRVWFFGAGRWETTNTPGTFSQSGVAYTRTEHEPTRRAEGDGPLRLADTISGTYINNGTKQANASGVPAAAILDSNVLVTRNIPNRLLALNYSGIVGNSMFATLQYSQKRQDHARQRRHETPRSATRRSRRLARLCRAASTIHAPYFDADRPRAAQTTSS